MSEIFISHAEEDADVALTVALELERAGYRTWTYEVDSVPGPSYLLQTGESVERSDVVVLVISPTSLGSHQVTREVVRGLETGKPFVPLLRGVTHVEFQNRQPEWRSAVGAATSIQVPDEGVSTIVPRIVAGLSALDVAPDGSIEKSRLEQVSAVLDTYLSSSEEPAMPLGSPPPLSADPPPTPVGSIGSRSSSPVKLSAVALAVIILAAGLWWYAQRVSDAELGPASNLVEAPGPQDILDTTEQKQHLVVLSDLDGHYVAVVPYWESRDAEYYFYYGDAKRLHAQRVRGGGASGEESFNYSFWDPRFAQSAFVFRDELYFAQCGEHKIPLTPVNKSEASVVVDAGEFYKPLWKHYAFALARDEAGEYFYVDRSHIDDNQFRFFSGRKGSLQRQSISDVVSDTAGAVITTKAGRLSINLKAGEVETMAWTADGEATQLKVADIWPNLEMIYGPELGVYPATLGTVCDILTDKTGQQ